MIRLEVLGGLRVFLDGEELRSLPSKPRRAALLVYLACERETTREKVCWALWPESDPDRARHALSQTLYELAHDLGDGWLERAGEQLRTTDLLDVDLRALEVAVDLERHGEVIERYRGPFLDGVLLGGGVEFEHWVDRRRSAIHRGLRLAFRHATRAEGDAGRRARLAREWVQLDPLDDEAHHALIESLAAGGDRSAALARYREYEEIIAAELDIEPLDQTKELIERIKGGTAPGPDYQSLTPPDRAASSEQVAATFARGVGPFGPDLQVVRLLGQGSSGSVFLAREPSLRRLVAVKVLDVELSRDAVASARFEREAQSAGRLLHPHVATVFRVGVTDDDRPYLVMPYVKGVTLADRLGTLGSLPTAEARRILSEVASALAAAHQAGVVHRDVRPENVLCEEGTGRTFLSDFGVAGLLASGEEVGERLTRTDDRLGDPRYVSPEQRRGAPVDERSDIYSLGVMGWELLGVRPEASARLEPQGTDEGLVALLRRATSEEASRRPTASELAAALSDLAGSEARRQEPTHRPRRRRLLYLLIVAGVALAGALVATVLLLR